MKIRASVWATGALLLAGGFCVLRVGTLQARGQSQERATAQVPNLTPEEWAYWDRSNKQAADRNKHNREHNYKVKQNNGSKRAGVLLSQVPEDIRDAVQKAVEQYEKGIYPILRKATDKTGGLLRDPVKLPGMKPYLVDSDYKGTGFPSPDWNTTVFGWRMDGTMIARDLFSKNAPDEPHDVWFAYYKFIKPSKGGTGDKGYIIHGWDDGRATIDPVEDNYYGIVHRPTGDGLGTAPPGAAGIPPSIPQGQKAWLAIDRASSQQEPDGVEAEEAKGDQPKAGAAKPDAKAAKPDQPKAQAPKQ